MSLRLMEKVPSPRVVPINAKRRGKEEPIPERQELSLEQRIHAHFGDAFAIWVLTAMENAKDTLQPWIDQQPQVSRAAFDLIRLCETSYPYIESDLTRMMGMLVIDPTRREVDEEAAERDEDDDEALTLMDDGSISRKLLRATLQSRLLDRYRDQLHVLDARCAMATREHGGVIESEMPRIEPFLDSALRSAMKIGRTMGFGESFAGVDLRLILLRESERGLMKSFGEAISSALLELDASKVPPYTTKAGRKAIEARIASQPLRYARSGPSYQAGVRTESAPPPMPLRAVQMDEGPTDQDAMEWAHPPPYQGSAPQPSQMLAVDLPPQSANFGGFSAPHYIPPNGGGEDLIVAPKSLIEALSTAIKQQAEEIRAQPKASPQPTPEPEPEAQVIQVGCFDEMPDPEENQLEAATSELRKALPPYAANMDRSLIIKAASQRVKIVNRIIQGYMDDDGIPQDVKIVIEAITNDLKKIAALDVRFLTNPAHPCRAAIEGLIVAYRLASAMAIFPNQLMGFFEIIRGHRSQNAQASCAMIPPHLQKIIFNILEDAPAIRDGMVRGLAEKAISARMRFKNDTWTAIIERCLIPCAADLAIQLGERADAVQSVVDMGARLVECDSGELSDGMEVMAQIADLVQSSSFPESTKQYMKSVIDGSFTDLHGDVPTETALIKEMARPGQWFICGRNHMACVTGYSLSRGQVEIHHAFSKSGKELLTISEFLDRVGTSSLKPAGRGIDTYRLVACAKALTEAMEEGADA